MGDLGLDHAFNQGAPESLSLDTLSMDSVELWTLSGLITETIDGGIHHEQYDAERWKTLPRTSNVKKVVDKKNCNVMEGTAVIYPNRRRPQSEVSPRTPNMDHMSLPKRYLQYRLLPSVTFITQKLKRLLSSFWSGLAVRLNSYDVDVFKNLKKNSIIAVKMGFIGVWEFA